jgi:ATP-dependent Clp endopeptidase proteolytic subunit ClpP
VVEGRTWFKVSNAEGADGAPARLDIYDEIGWFGVTASAFVEELNGITADAIELHINSPGGDVYDGIAIYNAILDHDAKVEVRVDGLAASAASFIAQAGDRVVMGRNSEMMIHDAIGLTVGNAADHRVMAEMLDGASDNLAAIYASRAGNGGVKSWRKRMEDETWYSAEEAVAAGLADAVLATPRRRGEAAASAEPRWDLSVFQHSSRADAPAPEVPKVAAADEKVTLEDVEDQKCPECGSDVAEGATSCPNCGASMREDETEDELDLLDLADEFELPNLKALHGAFLDAAESATGEDLSAVRMVLTEPDFDWDPDVLRGTLLDGVNRQPDPPEDPPAPVPTTIPISQVADALREALMP